MKGWIFVFLVATGTIWLAPKHGMAQTKGKALVKPKVQTAGKQKPSIKPAAKPKLAIGTAAAAPDSAAMAAELMVEEVEMLATVTIGGTEVPFWFDLKTIGSKKMTASIRNGAEVIPCKERPLENDSVLFAIPVFESEIRCKIERTAKGYEAKGSFVRYDGAKERRYPFMATDSKGVATRFPIKYASVLPLQPRYAVSFGKKEGGKMAVGAFKTLEGNMITGTFETPTGDYRHLEGVLSGDSLFLSCFDGTHAYRIEAQVSSSPAGGDSLKGVLISGGRREPFWGKGDDAARLPDALTLSKPASEKPVFTTYQDLLGKPVSLADPEFVGKAVVLQVMGTWCPNCMDETAFLSEYAATKKPADLAIVGLAFERKTDPAFVKGRIDKLRERYAVPYPVWIGGLNRSDSASARMPYISKVAAFPTTVFLDKSHVVRYVHTGFSGPATGAEYEDFKKEFDRLVAEVRK